MTEQKVYESIVRIIEKKKEIHLFNKAFLKPIEIALKTSQTTLDAAEQDPEKSGKLPFGLMQAVKGDIDENKFTYHPFCDFETIKEDRRQGQPFDFQYLFMNNHDNLVNLMKKKKDGIEIAMCICMYSEDKPMLQKTISGVAKNVGRLIALGVEPHEIGVFVLMDGIEPVDQSINFLMEQMESENQMFFDHSSFSENDLLGKDSRDMDEQYEANIVQYIFSPSELEDRKKRRFSTRKREYHKVKKLIRRVDELVKDKRITFDTLDEEILPYFFKVAREIHRKDFGDTEKQAESYSLEMLKENYAENINVCRPIIYQALFLAKQYFKQYISSRDQLALLNTFRVEVTVPSVSRPNSGSHSHNNLNPPEEENEQQRNAFMNLFFVTKYKNAGKLSSHNWFFNGFCKEFNPKFAFLIDVGLAPEENSLVKMYIEMKEDKKIGGVCGYMGLRIQKVETQQLIDPSLVDWLTPFVSRFVDIQRAQQVQYHFAHLIDKPFESIFGFIHVLPGAFSAYRVSALQRQYGSQSDDKIFDSQLLTEYFESIDMGTGKSSEIQHIEYTPMKAVARVILPDFFFSLDSKSTEQGRLYDENIFLAEDRTLCMGIKENKYTLKYIPDAYAWVDPIKTLHGLLGQRKRWINGSFFAFQKVKHVLTNSDRVQNKCTLWIQIYYLQLMNKLAFISPALFLFTIHIAMFAFQSNIVTPFLERSIGVNALADTQSAHLFIYIIDFIYIMLFLALIFLSMHLTHRDKLFLPYVYVTSTIYGLFSLTVFIVLSYDIIKGLVTDQQTFLIDNQALISILPGGIAVIDTLRFIIVGIILLYILPIVTSLICFRRWDYVSDIIFGTLSFLFYNPTYLNILNLYSLCRIDDISWGTKGLDAESDKNKSLKESWKKIKLIHVSKYVFYNVVMGVLLIGAGNAYISRFFMTFVVMIALGLTMLFKVLLGAVYIIKYTCCGIKQPPSRQSDYRRQERDQIQVYFNQIKESLYEEISKMLYKAKVNPNQNRSQINNFNQYMNNLSTIQEKKFKVSVKNRNNKINQNQSKILQQSFAKIGQSMRMQKSTNNKMESNKMKQEISQQQSKKEKPIKLNEQNVTTLNSKDQINLPVIEQVREEGSMTLKKKRFSKKK